MKRTRLLLILVTITIVASTIWHLRKMPVTLDDEALNSCLAVLESTRDEIITNVELRENMYSRFLSLALSGGTRLGDECVKVLINDDSNSDSVRKAQLVLAQLDLTDKQAELLDDRAKKNPVIWSYARLRDEQTDHLGGGYPGFRVEHLPGLLGVIRRHENLGSPFSKFSTITDIKAVDLDKDDDIEYVIKSADWGANSGTSYLRIFMSDSNDVVEISAENPFIVSVLLLNSWSLGRAVIAVPDEFYLESLSATAVRYVGTLALHYSLYFFSEGNIDRFGEVWMPWP